MELVRHALVLFVAREGADLSGVKIALTDMVPSTDGNPGEAAIEVDISDSISGDTLTAGVLRIRGSLAGTDKVKEEWRAVDGAFHDWAHGLLDYMDRNQAE